MPNFHTQKIGPGDQSWLGSAHGLGNARTEYLDPTDFTSKVREKVIPSGTALALDGGKLKPYNSGGSGDEAKLIGFLLTDQPTTEGKVAVAVLDHGRVRTDRLPESGFTKPTAENDLTTITYINLEG